MPFGTGSTDLQAVADGDVLGHRPGTAPCVRIFARFDTASGDDLMGKGRFVNQKLGKNVSRKLHLLKSSLAGRTNHKSLFPSVNPPLPKKGISREKP
jgi:hypothetical protein